MAPEKEKQYRAELEYQLKHSDDGKEVYAYLHETYRRGFIAKYLQGGLAFLAEAMFYLLFLACFSGTLYFAFFDPLSIDLALNKDLALEAEVTSEELKSFMIFTKLLMLAISLFWLWVGLMFRAVRKKNETIDKLTEILDEARKVEEERLERIKSVLV